MLINFWHSAVSFLVTKGPSSFYLYVPYTSSFSTDLFKIHTICSSDHSQDSSILSKPISDICGHQGASFLLNSTEQSFQPTYIMSSYKSILITAKVTSQLFCCGHLMPWQLRKCVDGSGHFQRCRFFLIWGRWAAGTEEQKQQRWTLGWLETTCIGWWAYYSVFGYLESKCIEAISDHYLEYLHVISCDSCKTADRVMMRVPGAFYHAQFLASCLQIMMLAMLADVQPPGLLS